MIFVGEICRQSRTKTFRASLGKFGQKFCTPQTVVCCHIYGHNV